METPRAHRGAKPNRCRTGPVTSLLCRPVLEVLEDRLVLSTLITIDAAAGRHAIDSNIYGTGWADPAALADLNVPLNRAGGNLTSTYNWQQNASNHASDWYFESISDDGTAPGASIDQFISDARSAGSQASITIPTLGWVAKLGPNRSNMASFSVAKYGAQQSTDPWMPDAGNGVKTNGQLITGNDPNDANVPADVNFEKAWLQHLVAQWGNSANGGVRYYILDNEPSLWSDTHRDVHPTGPTMDEVLDKFLAYATMIKSVDPGAKIIGPEEWGWPGYFYSGYDQQYANQHGWSSFPDQANHGGMAYLPWLLDQIHQHDTATGQRLLDDFTVHYYPQSGEDGNDVSRAMQLLRNQSTRSLWDPNYVDVSWIDDKVDLIPRLRNWVNTYYAGTKVGITEYNWGAEGHMNGATTQADILGIFGREGLDLANRWETPAASTPTYLAMKMYRNYDGQRSTFGDTSIATTTANPDQLSAFSAIRSSDGALTLMVVNKDLYDPANPSATTSITLNLANFSSTGTAQEWQLAALNPSDQTRSSIRRLSDVTLTGSGFTLTVPKQSVTLFVLTPGQVKAPASPAGLTATAGDGRVSLSWSGSAGAGSYNLYRSTTPGGEGSTPFRAGLTSLSFTDTSVNNGATYYYQVSAVNAGGESTHSSEVLARPVAASRASVAIDAGGGAQGSYLSDTGFSGGQRGSTTHAISTTGVVNPSPQGVYQTLRSGNFSYTVTGLTPSTSYLVRLHFAEFVVNAAGQRRFNVLIGSSPVLTNFDIFAAAGGRFRAVVREVLATASSSGTIVLQFRSVFNPAQINGIEVLPRAVLAVAAGGSGGGLYQSDAFFSGGLTASTTATINTSAVSDPAPFSVYQSERYGDFTYTLPGLIPGQSYTVRLDFAEIFWTGPGQRTFNVKINGTQVLTNFDIFATAGGKNRAVRREFTATANSQGQIVIDFISVVNYAKVSGIAVY